MRVILTIAGLGSEFGGPSRSVPTLATVLGGLGADVELVTTMAAGSGSPPLLPPPHLVRAHLLPAVSRSTRWSPRGNAFVHTLRARCSGRKDVVIHDQGLWLASNHAVAFAAREMDRPRIISPRGMLSSWALTAKGLKKKMAWSLYQRRDLMDAAALHVTSSLEADECRRTGYFGPMTIVPNGTDLPPAPLYGHVPGLEDPKANLGSDQRVALCLSRLHPVKGLSSLLEAWAQIRPAGWRLVLAGRDEGGHMAELHGQSAAGGLAENVEILGEVGEQDKWSLYRSADLFVLPSYSENFGIVVAEALASGLPVLTTRGTPWLELVDERCGWWVDVGVAPLAEALRVALATSSIDLRAMGARGRRLVEEKYTWAGAAQAMLTFYESVLRQHRDRLAG